MKLLLSLLIILSFKSFANEKLGLGVSIGSPIGLHYIYDLAKQKRIEGAIGTSMWRSGTSLDAQLVTTEKNRFKLQAYDLDLNLGYGGKIVAANKTKFGPSGLAGVSHHIQHTQFTILTNSGAAIMFGDGISLDINIYLGANYHF